MKPKALVLTPFDDSPHLVREAVERGLRKADVVPVLIEQILSPGAAWVDAITSAIQESDIVVADVTQRHPNVYFELGFVHALRKSTVLLVNIESAYDLPSDLVGYHIIAYDPNNLDALTHRIKRFVHAHIERLRDAV